MAGICCCSSGRVVGIGGVYTTFFKNQQRQGYKGVRFGELEGHGLGLAYSIHLPGRTVEIGMDLSVKMW
jgi:hypothetical protein